MSSKPALRQKYLTLRNSFSPSYRQQASDLVTAKILDLPVIRQASSISVFISTGSEINTHPLINSLLKMGKQVSVPVIHHDHIFLRHLSSLESCLPGPMNILEPPSTEPSVEAQTIDVFVVPGLSFDTYGYRLGYGKGYYDRLLASTPGYRLGIGFTDQLTYSLPHHDHDVRLHQILTEPVSLSSFPFVEKSLS